MNVIKLNEILSNNDDALYSIIESLGFDNISEKHGNQGGYFAFPNLDGDNKGASACGLHPCSSGRRRTGNRRFYPGKAFESQDKGDRS